MESLLGRQLNYTVRTSVYEGPLDLLLDLIERAELDITSVSLAAVTDQYLASIKDLEKLNADEISAFLVIAAKLLQIKSEALLPRPPQRERSRNARVSAPSPTIPCSLFTNHSLVVLLPSRVLHEVIQRRRIRHRIPAGDALGRLTEQDLPHRHL